MYVATDGKGAPERDGKLVAFDGFQDKDVYAFHIHQWKRPILEAYFPNARFSYIPFHLSVKDFDATWAKRIEAAPNPTILTWGVNLPPEAAELARRAAIPVYYMEDGFLRSVNPHASRTAPFSLSIDSKAPYFDCHAASDLETLLQNYPFEHDPDLKRRAAEGIAALLELRLSKYNAPRRGAGATTSRKDGQRRVLVLGQVEDDASIKRGCLKDITNNDLVRLAASENPDADLIYKPHPDVLNGVRRGLSNPAEVENICMIMREPLALPDALEGVDHVYTITSLGGFEALLRGIHVTVIGCPFYAGWGLTDDRQPNMRRRRSLTVEELFAGAYLLYPRYFHPITAEPSSFEECLELMHSWQLMGMPPALDPFDKAPVRPQYAIWGPYGLFGWRHLLTRPVSMAVSRIGNASDVEAYRRDPIRFFRELSDPKFRRIGKILYPWDA